MGAAVPAEPAGTAANPTPGSRRAPLQRAGVLGALGCGMLSVQVGASLGKMLFPVLGAAHTAGLRILFAALILLPLAWAARNRVGRAGPGAEASRNRMGRDGTSGEGMGRAGALLAIGLYGTTLGAMNLVFYLALARLPLGIVVAIEFIGPLCLALLGSRRRLDLLWIGCAVGGLVLLLQPWRTAHGLDPVGLLLACAAGLAWAIYILAGRRLGRYRSGITATALGMAVAALVTLPVSLPAVPALFGQFWLLPAAFGMALLSSAVPYSIEMMAMQRMSMRGFSVLMSLEPAIAAIAGLLLLGEQLSGFRWLAIGLIVVASLGSAATDRPPPDTMVPPTGQ